MAGGAMDLFPLGASLVVKADTAQVNKRENKHMSMYISLTTCHVSVRFLL